MPNTLQQGQWLEVGQSLWSENGRIEFKMQRDGKIAVYHDGECVWQNTPEQRDDIKGIWMQEDGNLCMYTHNGLSPRDCAWHSNTASSNGSYCIVQDDGNVVVYDGNKRPLWASNTGA